MNRDCIVCGHERLGTPWRTQLYIREERLVWICQPCVDAGH